MFNKNNGSSGKNINSSSSSHNSPSHPINYRQQATFGLKAHAGDGNKATTNNDQEESKSQIAKSEELSEIELNRLNAELASSQVRA